MLLSSPMVKLSEPIWPSLLGCSARFESARLDFLMVRHGHAIFEISSTTWAYILCDGNDTIRALTALRPRNKWRICYGKFEPFGLASQAGFATGYVVEGSLHWWVGRRKSAWTKLSGIDSFVCLGPLEVWGIAELFQFCKSSLNYVKRPGIAVGNCCEICRF